MVVADHVQRVMKPNFAASWEEIGDENQVEETFALSSMKDIQGSTVKVHFCVHEKLCELVKTGLRKNLCDFY